MLILLCTRSKDESSEMAENPLIPECPDFCTPGLATQQHIREDPIKVLESRGLFIALVLMTQNPIDSSEGRKKRGLFSVPPMTYVVFVPRDENTGFVTGGSRRVQR